MKEEPQSRFHEYCPPVIESRSNQLHYKSEPVKADCSLIINAKLPPDTLIGVGGRVIIQAIQPNNSLRYFMSRSARMDEWHHKQRSVHVDLFFPVLKNDFVEIFVDGDINVEFLWLNA